MQDTKHIKGLSALSKYLDNFPPKFQRNIARGALRAGMNVVKPVAQSKVHSISGELAKGLKISTNSKGGQVVAKLKATGKHRSVAHLVEFGTRAHLISAKFKGMLSFMNVFRKTVMHPGAQPKAFMRPALDSKATPAVVAVGNYIKTRLETKLGIDTSHIKVEGDE